MKPVVLVRGLTVSYAAGGSFGVRGSRRVVVEELTFDFGVGCTALVGDNGSGKTSVLRAIVDEQARDAGEIIVGGRHLGAGRVAYVPQSPATTLSPWLTVLDECTLAGRIKGQPRRVRVVALQNLLSGLNLQLPLDRRVTQLSGGQQVLVALARAMLVQEPALLVLDEPYEGLSGRARIEVNRIIRTVANRLPVLLTSHRPEDHAALGARVLRLVGTPVREVTEVAESPESFRFRELATGAAMAAEPAGKGSANVVKGQRLHQLGDVGVGLTLGLAIWKLFAMFADSRSLPHPDAVLHAAMSMIVAGELAGDLLATLSRAFGGWLVAVALAIPFAVGIGLSSPVYRLAAPWLAIWRCVPVFALAATAIAVFPRRPELQRFSLIFGTLFLIAIQIISLATHVAPRHRVTLARIFGAGRWFRLSRVLLNEIRGGIVSAAETTLPISLIVAFVVETTLLPRVGLGQYVYNHLTETDLSPLWAALLVPATVAAVGMFALRAFAPRGDR